MLNFGPGIFSGFVGSPRNIFGFVLPPFDHPSHLKSGVPPPPAWDSLRRLHKTFAVMLNVSMARVKKKSKLTTHEKMVPGERIADKVTFEWSYHSILCIV